MFDGASFVLNADRALAVQMPAGKRRSSITHWTRDGGQWVCAAGAHGAMPTEMEPVYRR